MSDRLRETDAAKAIFEESGTSISQWAKSKGFSTNLVYAVLDGKRKCMRGESHKIAVALGLKKGRVMDLDEVSESLVAAGQAHHSGEQIAMK